MTTYSPSSSSARLKTCFCVTMTIDVSSRRVGDGANLRGTPASHTSHAAPPAGRACPAGRHSMQASERQVRARRGARRGARRSAMNTESTTDSCLGMRWYVVQVVRPPADTTSALASFTCLRRARRCTSARRPPAAAPGRTGPGERGPGTPPLAAARWEACRMLRSASSCIQPLPSCQPLVCRGEEADQMLLGKQAPGPTASSTAPPAGAPPWRLPPTGGRGRTGSSRARCGCRRRPRSSAPGARPR